MNDVASLLEDSRESYSSCCLELSILWVVVSLSGDRICSSSVSTVTWLWARWLGFRFLAGTGFFPHHQVQTSPGSHTASCPVGTGDNVAGAWSWPLTSIWH